MIRAAFILALIVELIFGVVNRGEATALMLEAADETCCSQAAAFIAVLHEAYTQEKSSLLLYAKNVLWSEDLICEYIDPCVSSATEWCQPGSINGVKIASQVNALQSGYQESLRSDRFDDGIRVSLINYRDLDFESFSSYQPVLFYEGDTSHNKARPVTGEELQSSNGMLLLLNIGLTPRYEHLFFRDISVQPRSLIRFEQQSDLEKNTNGQDAGEPSQHLRVISDRLGGDILNCFVFGCVCSGLYCLVVWRLNR
jgi:hypothetical protein